MRTATEGQPAPDFSLRDQHGADVTLSEFAGERAVLLVFYPYAFSRVCTGELRALRDNMATFQSENAQVLGVSCDPMFALRAFAEADSLRFPLLSDFWPHGAVSSAYGAFDKERGCSTRSTFVIDSRGVLRRSIHNAIPDARDLHEYVRVLREIAK